jgi:hypothetical protein
MERKDFYVYLHRRATDNEVFYVGKGAGPRASQSTKRNEYWQRTAKKHGVIIEYVEKELTESDAFDLEIELIKFYREAGHPLTNLTDGGEGISGLVRTEEHCKRISAAKMGHVQSEETRRKMSENRPKTPVVCSNGMSFDSITAATEWVKSQGFVKINKGGIQNCCSGRLDTCAGFRWRYIINGVIDETNHDCAIDEPIKYKTKTIRNIFCSNGMKFESVKKAETWLRQNGFPDANIATIRRRLSNSTILKCAYGFLWSYEEFCINIEPKDAA